MGLTLSSNKYAKTFNSFSGADIFIIFENATVGTITQLSWNITREKAPLYVLGHVDAVGTSRGKRSIAGSLTGLIFDRWTLFDLAWGSDITGEGGRTGEYAEYARKTGDILVPGDLMFVDYADIYGTDVAPGTRAWPVGGGGSAEEAWKKMLGWEPSRVVYADQMLPCDVTIVGINEAGNFMVSRIFGIDLLSTGAGISIDDVTMEEQYTWFAMSMLPFLPRYTGGEGTGLELYNLLKEYWGLPGSEMASLKSAMETIARASRSGLGTGSTTGGTSTGETSTGGGG